MSLDYGNNSDTLRVMVARYVISILGPLGENGAFKELLEERRHCVFDFWNII